MFLLGLLLVALSAIAAPWAQTFLLLLLLRLFQSIGSSAIYPAGISLIHRHVHDKQASAMAVIAVSTSATAALGPTIGGLLVSWWDWPVIFTVNLPILMVSFLLSWFFLPQESKEPKQPLSEIIRKLDLPGILLFALTVSFGLWFLLSLETGFHAAIGLLAIICLTGFIWRERQAKEPFINIRIFRQHPALSAVFIQFIIMNMFNYSLFFGLPTYFQNTMHLDVKQSGLLMLSLAGFSVIASPAAGKWTDRVGYGRPLLAGAACMVTGSLCFTVFFTNVPLTILAGILSIMGLSYGFLNVSLQAAMLAMTPSGMIGMSSGLFQTSRYLGSISSSVVLGLIFGQNISAPQLQILGYALMAMSMISLVICFKLWRITEKMTCL